MEKQIDQLRVETAYGIVDVYDSDVTSFSMVDDSTCHVKHRIDSDIAISFDIEIV